MNIIQAGKIGLSPAFDVDLVSVAVIMVSSTASGDVSVVMENGETLVLNEDQISQLYPKITKINTTGTTILAADIYLAYL